MTETYGLLVPFEDKSESFVNGFEAGMIWQNMQKGISIDQSVHVENESVIKKMAVATGYEITLEKTDIKGWLHCKGEKNKPAPVKGNPLGFTVIKGKKND